MATVNLGKIKPLWRGDYSASETYRPLDFVEYNGQLYINILESIGNLPTNTTYFELVVEPNNIVHAPGTGLPNEAGTAYSRDVTTSNTDSTAGRLLKVGDGGLQIPQLPVNDAQTINMTNFRTIDLTSPFGGGPTARASILEFAGFGTADRGGKIAVIQNTQAPRIAVQSRNVGGLSPWREIYHTGNILGTVSATGTYPNLVPTGAIMESGSNVNGDYVKYADGTMICSVDRTQDAPISTPANGGFRSAGFGWTYPTSFIENPKVLSSSASASAFTTQSRASNSGLGVYTYMSVTSQSSAIREISLMAIGRWK